MPINLSIKPIIPKLPALDLGMIAKQELEKEAKKIQQELGFPTRTWKHKVSFSIDSVTSNEIKITTNDEIYGYLNEGTKPHIIKPKRAKRLHFFRTGFVSKTRVGILNARAGRQATKDETFSLGVHHPGIKARKWTQEVQKRSEKRFKENIGKAIKLALARKS